jgi:hypothetical protein
MASPSEQSAGANPLGNAGILEHVFTFLPGNWLFLGAVCSEWKAVYAGIADQQLLSVSLYGNGKLVTCGTKTTLYSAAVASPATARMAYDAGLVITYASNVQVIAGLHADFETLTALMELRMPISDALVKALALSGRARVLQQLWSVHPYIRPINLTHYAARSGNISMLNWLRTKSWCHFGSFTCSGAAFGGQLATLQHLREEGCEWSEHAAACAAVSSGSTDVVEWLQQQGIEINAAVMTGARNWPNC